jgi:hypothetical protein
MSKSFYSGFEEVVSRIISLILNIIFVSIYILAREQQVMILDWSKILILLGIFWISQELLSLGLFFIFCQFSKDRIIQDKPIESKNIPPQIDTDYNLDKNLSDK